MPETPDAGLLDTLLAQNSNAVEQRSTTSLRTENPLKAWLLDWAGPGATDVKGREYKSSVWVYACLNWWLKLAAVPIALTRSSKGGGFNPVSRGPVYDPHRRPNPQQTCQEFMQPTILHLGVYGEYYWLRNNGTQTDPGTVPLFLTVANPKSMIAKREDRTADGEIFRYTLKSGKSERKIPLSAVIKGQLPNPYSSEDGLAPMDALRLTVDADYAARVHNKTQMSNRGRIEGIVQYDETVTDPDKIRDFREAFDSAFGGGANAGKFVHAMGIKDIKQLSQPMKDLDWLEGQKLGREEICAAYGIPPPMVGILDRATYTNFDQARLTTWEDTLIPMGNMIACRMQEEFADRTGENVTISFDYIGNVPVLRDHQMKKAEIFTNLVQNGRLTANQAAEWLSMKIPDMQAIHDEVLVPFNMIPANVLLEGGQSPSGPATPPAEPNDNLEPVAQEAIAMRVADLITARIGGQVMGHLPDPVNPPPPGPTVEDEKSAERTEAVRSAMWRSHMFDRSGFERSLAKAAKKYFMEQRASVLNEIDVFLAENPGLFAKALPEDFLERVLPVTKWAKAIKQSFGRILDAAFKRGAEGVLQEMDLPLDMVTPIDAWRKQQDVLLANVNETTRGRLLAVKDVLDEGISQGLSVEEIAENIKNRTKLVYRDRERDRHRIARTEVNRAFNAARIQQMDDAGIEFIEWLSSRDDSVRDSHVSMDGTFVQRGDLFGNGLRFPHDPAGPASEVVNCRCVIVAKT